MRKILFLVPIALVVAFSIAKPMAADEGFDRAQNMVVNLNRAPESAGYYLLKDIRLAKEMDHDLGKAVNQVQAVDHTYAKLRGCPDDKFMEAVAIKIQKVQNSRALLEEDLEDAYVQLKSSIKDTMITDEERKKHK